MRFSFFIIVLTFLINAEVLAIQKQSGKTIAAKYSPKTTLFKDSSKVIVRKFNEDQITSLSKQKEFIYDDVAPAKLNAWQRFWQWFWRMMGHMFNGNNYGPVVKYLLIAIVIALLTYVVIKLMGLNLKMLTGKSKKVDVPYGETLENIHEIDFDEQIDMALSNGNYRLGVRLLYLKTLKKLSDRQLIVWQPQKTNQAYVVELENENDRKAFGELTTKFEYIWYGEFHIDRSAFEQVHQSFLNFSPHSI
jgi:hypothetical protein